MIPAMLRPGDRLGPYEIQNTLGAGGMGEVYRARDTRLDRTVAIKVLPAPLASDPQSKERFHREARTISQLDHPNICALYDVGEHEGTSYLVMQHLEGETLRERVARSGLPLPLAVGYAIDIANALVKAHALGIVHRDLKPANVMITASGGKLLDFGIAKLTQAPQSSSMDAPTIDLHTGQGVVIGTARYMSPEQARGLTIDARSDVFSFGVVLYEMLAGQAPFDGTTHADVLVAILERQPAPLAHLRTDAPTELQRIVSKCIEKAPVNRYASAEALLKDLEKLKGSLTGQRESQPTSIVVLPFVNMSADPENEYFCDGVAEDLINALTKIEQLRVVARTTAFSFKGKTGDLREIGKTLNVSTVLEGSVRKSGNRLRVTAQLVNVADGYQIWSDRYDRQLEDVFEIQDEISLAIVNALKVKLLGSEKAALAKRQTENVEAYQLYLQGRHQWHKWSADGFAKSAEFMKRAIELDPDYALAYCGVADVYLAGTLVMRPYEAVRADTKAALARALELDPTLDTAWTLTAVSYMIERNWAAHERAALRALELNPRSGHAQIVMGLGKFYQGHAQDALSYAKRSVELDPLAQFWNFGLAQIYMGTGDLNAARERIRILLEIDPSFWMAYLLRGALLTEEGKLSEAIQSFDEAIRFSGAAPYAVGWRAAALALAGERERSEKDVAALLEASKHRFVSSLSLAIAYAGLGDIDNAFQQIEQACSEWNIFLWYHVHYTSLFAAIRRDPRMTGIFQRAGIHK